MQTDAVAPLRLEASVEDNIQAAAKVLRKRVQDVVVLVMDRPRHQRLVDEIRQIGAALRMVGDGDIAAAIAPSIPDSGIDLYLGVGGSPEAVLAAAALKCLGGDIQTRMWPRDDAERRSLIELGHEAELQKVFFADDLAHGKHVIFCATGISDSSMLRGVRVRNETVITHSLIMRAHTRSLRYIETFHDLRTKKVRLRSTRREHAI
jgi:fructose-1,6-bisphosphatase II